MLKTMDQHGGKSNVKGGRHCSMVLEEMKYFDLIPQLCAHVWN